jgi:23S rRNA G2445 N2-methylase RlmL
MRDAVAIFALTTCGLEQVSAAEIAALSGVRITEVGYRRIAASCVAPPAALLALRTVDDLFLDLGSWPGIGRSRDALVRLRAAGRRLDLGGASARCAEVRPLHTPPTFAVTASFVGRRNYTTAEIKAAVAAGIGGRGPWRCVERDDDADLGVRVFIEGEVAHIGVRLGARPLHERGYRRVAWAGALRPPVAAAMLALAGAGAGGRVLDPCCGSGTIVVEAARGGACTLGGDVDPEAVAAARANVDAAGVGAALCRLDARVLPLAGGLVDCVVANLPWGRQVGVCEPLEVFYGRVLREMRRVVVPGGRVVLLTAAPELISAAGWRCRERIAISLAGQRPTVVILSA